MFLPQRQLWMVPHVAGHRGKQRPACCPEYRQYHRCRGEESREKRHHAWPRALPIPSGFYPLPSAQGVELAKSVTSCVLVDAIMHSLGIAILPNFSFIDGVRHSVQRP